MIRILLGLLCPVVASETIYVTTGGCDGAMKNCTDNKTAEATIQAIELSKDGSMKLLDQLATDTGGSPNWATISRNCFFTTLGDKSTVVAYALDAQNARLKGLVGFVASNGSAPVYAEATADGKLLLVANYHGPDDSNISTGAAATLFAIGSDCSLTLVKSAPHNGFSKNPLRQGGAHVHSFVSAGAGSDIAYACDLGMDIIFSYRVGGRKGLVEVNRTKTVPGSGPRHSVHHPKLPFLFVVSEMGMTVTAYREVKGADGALTGGLQLIEMYDLVPKGQKGDGSKAAEIAITPSGDTVYATNRGLLNSVTVFAVSSEGKLTQKQQVAAPDYPRGMTMALNGTILLVAGQTNGEVVSYNVAADGGTLTATGHKVETGANFHPAAFAVVPAHAEPQIMYKLV